MFSFLLILIYFAPALKGTDAQGRFLQGRLLLSLSVCLHLNPAHSRTSTLLLENGFRFCPPGKQNLSFRVASIAFMHTVILYLFCCNSGSFITPELEEEFLFFLCFVFSILLNFTIMTWILVRVTSSR